MLKTKLLSVFVAFALMITVGGVYATWNYSDGAMSELEYTRTHSIFDLTEDSAGSTKGSFSFNTTTFKVIIDDIDDGVAHHAVLDFEGEIVLVFTPDEMASNDVKENGIGVKFALSNNESLVWGGESIFNLYTTAVVAGSTITIGEDSIDVPDLVKQTDGTFTWTLTADFFENLIALRTTPLILDTHDDYNTFENLLAGNKVTLTFSEAN